MDFNMNSDPVGIYEMYEEAAEYEPHYRFTYDAINGKIRPIKVEFIDEEGLVSMDNIWGVGIFKFEYNEHAQKVKQTYHSPTDRLTELFGVAIVEFFYNDAGKEIEERFYNRHVELCSGLAITRFEYNDEGYLIEQRYFDKDGSCYADETTGVPILRFSYDDWGRLTEISFHNCSGSLIEDAYGIAYVRYFYWSEENGEGRLKEILKYDKDGIYVSE